MAVGLLLFRELRVETATAESSLYNLFYVWELFFPYLLLFSWNFPIDRAREFRLSRLYLLIFVPQMLHVVLLVLFSDVGGIIAFLNSGLIQEGFLSLVLRPLAFILTRILLLLNQINVYHTIVFGIINLLYSGLALYFLESGKSFLANPRLVTQTRIVLWGVRVGVGLYAVSFLLAVLLPSPAMTLTTNTLAITGLVIGTTILAYAIVRHQFLNVQLVLRQSLIYTFTSAILVGLYLLIGIRCEDALTPYFGERAEVVSWVIILFLLLLFQPINSWVDNIIRSMFMRTRSDHRNIIERFSRQIISQFDPIALRSAIEETLKTSLLVEDVYFVVFDDSVEEYAILQSEDNPRRIIIGRDDVMLRAINLLDVPTYYGTLADYEHGSPLAEFLSAHRVKVILPMKDSKHLLGFLALTSKAAGYRYTPEDINLLGVLSNQMVTALTNARLYVESLERLRLQEEVAMARQIQLDLLPAVAPALVGAELHATSIPSRTVGGDFYDFIPLPEKNRVGIVIADASGKGMPAALLIAQIQAILRSEVYNGNQISAILKNMNRLVTDTTSAEKYVTLFYAEYDNGNGHLYYANAGHNYPVLVRDTGEVELLITGGPVIGAFPFMEFSSESVALKSGDVIFFFTDGLSEAMNVSGVEFGEERIRQVIAKHRHQTVQEIISAVLDEVRQYDPSYPPQDDTTVIALKINDHEHYVN